MESILNGLSVCFKVNELRLSPNKFGKIDNHKQEL